MEENTKVKSLYGGTRVVWYILSVIEALLVFRFLLKLFGANPSAGFTHFIYTASSVFVGPFKYVFSTPDLGGSVFDFASLLAIAVYWVIAWGIVRLIVLGRPVSGGEAAHGVREQDTV